MKKFLFANSWMLILAVLSLLFFGAACNGDDFNYGLAVQTLDETVAFMAPSLNAANAR